MSKNSHKAQYSQLVEWLAGRGVDIKKKTSPQSKFNRNPNNNRK